MLEVVGAASSVIAVVEVTAKVVKLCAQYANDVKHASNDIDRLHRETKYLNDVSENTRKLLTSPQGASLKTSQELLSALNEGRSLLQDLQDRLRPRTIQKGMRKLGMRALKWPFQSKDVDKVVQQLKECRQLISSALQVDQT